MSNDFNKRAAFIVAICTGVTLIVAVAWMARVILLLLFAGVIGSLVLSTATNWCAAKFKLRRSLALTTVIASFVACVGMGVWISGPTILQQFSDLQTDLPHATQQVLARLQEQTLGRWLLSHFAGGDQWAAGLSFALGRIGGALVTTATVFVGLFVVASVSLYVAAEPEVYLLGLHRLTPVAYRTKLNLCLTSATQMLRSWLIAKALSMLCIGAFISIGLWALGVPLAGTLGIIAGLLTFIPNLGPVLSFLPAGLLAFAIGPTKGLLTLLLFCLAHFLEGNIVTPLLERRIATLPPALTLAVQLVLAILTGGLGVALAAPLTAAGLGILKVVLAPDLGATGKTASGHGVAIGLSENSEPGSRLVTERRRAVEEAS
jgi:predicted PurR-regulated permease PerM